MREKEHWLATQCYGILLIIVSIFFVEISLRGYPMLWDSFGGCVFFFFGFKQPPNAFALNVGKRALGTT
jgi:hypothetical protein